MTEWRPDDARREENACGGCVHRRRRRNRARDDAGRGSYEVGSVVGSRADISERKGEFTCRGE